MFKVYAKIIVNHQDPASTIFGASLLTCCYPQRFSLTCYCSAELSKINLINFLSLFSVSEELF